MHDSRFISDAFFWMINSPVFNIRLSMRSFDGQSHSVLTSINTFIDDRGLSDADEDRRAAANGSADLFASQGLHASKVTPTPEEGLIEIELNPLMVRHPLFAQTKDTITNVLTDIIKGIEYEIQCSSLKEWDDAMWMDYFGLASENKRLLVGVAYGTPLNSMPGLYNLHQIKDPAVLTARHGEAFTSAIKRVVYFDIWNGGMPAEELIALPLGHFEKLARTCGFDKFFYESDTVLWISKSA